MNKNKNKVSPETMRDAEAVAKATQRPGQTKEQTKLISQGIAKGIAEYKKQHKSKSRDLDKKLKKVNDVPQSTQQQSDDEIELTSNTQTTNKLPWVLLVLSWLTFAAYIIAPNLS